MAIQKSRAIVLKKFDFRDTSLIVTLFTRDFGKLKVVVKGVRKEGSADLVHFEVLNHLDIVFYEKAKTELHLLSESCIENSMLTVRNSFKSFVFGCYLAELVDALYDIHEPAIPVFDGLLASLENMTSERASFYALKFEVQVLKAAGLFPRVTACSRCSKSESTKWHWSPRQGGVVCSLCIVRESSKIELAPEIYSALVKIQSDEKFSLETESLVCDELEILLRGFIRERMDYPLRSIEFLKSADSFKSGYSLSPRY